MRLPGLWTIVGVLVLIGVIYVSLEPVSVFGYDAGALGESLEGEVEDAHGESQCEEGQPGRWICFTGISLGAAYQLTVDSDGCWSGRRIPYANDKTPPVEQVSACVDILDVTGLSDLIDV